MANYTMTNLSMSTTDGWMLCFFSWSSLEHTLQLINLWMKGGWTITRWQFQCVLCLYWQCNRQPLNEKMQCPLFPVSPGSAKALGI